MKNDSIMKNEIQNKEFETLSRLISFNQESMNDFLVFVLQELVNQTRSQKGYIFTISEKSMTFELTRMIDKSGSNKFINEQPVKLFEVSEAGPWIKALEQNKIIVMTDESKLFPMSTDKTVFEVSERFCSIHITNCKSINVVLVVSDKEADYDADDIQYLGSLTRPLTTIIENRVWIEALSIAKEKAEQNEKRKTSYLTNIAHEIKSPVNAISGFSNLLKESDQSDDNRKKFLDIILESSKNLVSIINSVLEISNFESGVVNIVKKEVNLNDLIKEVSEIFSEAASCKNLLFKTEANIHVADSLILADKERLKQILSCLLSNSLRFTYSGKIVLGCNLKDGFIEFFVSDTGSGISEENQKLVFDHFFQAGDSLSGSFKGVGLGLTIAKGYVERMGGKMWLISSEGKGSDFYFTIPFKRALSKQILKISQMTGISTPPDKRKIILVAEDNNINFTLIQNFLNKLDVELLWAENGKAAVELCYTNKFDLILMDIRMPVMDGYTATRLIKEHNPEQIIIAQTAYTNDRETALANGCDDFIAKPFGKDQLLSLVNTYI
jgi:signal transduction histidine kinase